MRVPKYRGPHRKVKGKGYVVVQNKKYYFPGLFRSEESLAAYADWLADFMRQQVPTPRAAEIEEAGQERLIDDLLLAYLRFAREYHSEVTLNHLILIAKRLSESFGERSISAFRPVDLEELQAKMVEDDLSRNYINEQVGRLRRIFKWGVAKDFLPSSQLADLKSVGGLRKGKPVFLSDGRKLIPRETDPVRPVDWELVEPVLRVVSPQIAAMIQLQWHTGMRSSELCIIKPGLVGRAGDVWVYMPDQHKTNWLGKTRKVYLGPQSQAILGPFLDRPADEYCFSPAEAKEWHCEQRRKSRQTPLTPSQNARTRKASPKRSPTSRYNRSSYRRAIVYGISKAFGEKASEKHWHPHQL